MATLYAFVFSLSPFTTREEMERLLHVWRKNCPDSLPSKFSYGDSRTRHKLDLSNVPKIEDDDFSISLHGIHSGLLFGRIDKARYGAGLPSHSVIHLEFESERVDHDRLCDLIRELGQTFRADFAFLHAITEFDLQNKFAGHVHVVGPKTFMFLTTHILRRYLPDLFWLSVFGEPYIELFGRDCLLTTPAFDIESKEGVIAIQLTKALEDCLVSPMKVQRSRHLAKTHLNHSAFFAQLEQSYQAPSFEPLFGKMLDWQTSRIARTVVTRIVVEDRAQSRFTYPDTECETLVGAERTFETSANFSLEDICPFLERIVDFFDSGFDTKSIDSITTLIAKSKLDDEAAIEFSTIVNGKQVNLEIAIFMDDDNSPDLYFRSTNDQIIRSIEDFIEQFFSATI